MVFRGGVLGLLLPFLCLPALAQGVGPLEGCEVGVRVLTPGDGKEGVIDSDAGGGMCVVRLADGDVTVTFAALLTRAADAGGAGGMVAMGTYACVDPGGVADPFEMQITEGGTYVDRYGSPGTWLRQEAQAILFNQGPLNGAIARLEGPVMLLSGSNLYTEMACTPKG